MDKRAKMKEDLERAAHYGDDMAMEQELEKNIMAGIHNRKSCMLYP